MKILKRSLILCFYSFLAIVSIKGQASIYTPSINLATNSLASSSVGLTWSSPPTATSCVIFYEANNIVTTHPVANYTSNQATIPRRNPTGTAEEFRAVFIDNLGDSLYHEACVINTYGGIVVVEEDIFAPVVIRNLDTLSPFHNCCFNIQPGDYTVSVHLMDSVTDAYLFRQGVFDTVPDTILNKINDTTYHDSVLSMLRALHALQNPGIKSISYSPLVFSVGDKPTPFSGDSLRQWRIGPCPFSDRIMMSMPEYEGEEQARISIRDASGALVHRQRAIILSGKRSLTIPTANWSPGMYYLMLTTKRKQFQAILLKH
jgi:hypothetical protein